MVVLLAVLVTGTGRAVDPTGSSTRVRHRRTTPTPTQTEAECRRIVLEVRAGVRTMRTAEYRRACGARPAGDVLDRRPAVPAKGAIGSAPPP